MQEWYLGWEKVSCLERCPQFRSVLIETERGSTVYINVISVATVNVELMFRLDSDIMNTSYTVTCTITGGTVLTSSFTGQTHTHTHTHTHWSDTHTPPTHHTL